jgi:hypothetical protein
MGDDPAANILGLDETELKEKYSWYPKGLPMEEVRSYFKSIPKMRVPKKGTGSCTTLT